ncbi:NUDIX hydrolase [Actinophytocola glycyrrhizae]|uniref:NUDIX domain-containing protein n=1 Tax=Actinophytocola glycyrrhizae TaxID=2044873 RepID=A0ABV9S4S7_9PSEU
MVALDVFLLFVRDSRLLLALRENTGYADGQWNVPSGKVEPGEEPLAAAVREAREEVAVEVDAARLATVVHVHRHAETPRVGFFFEAESWHGEPVNAEPHKYGGLRWVALDALPDNTVPYTTAGVTQYRKGITYGHLKW